MSIFSFLLLLFLLFFRRDEKPPPPHRIANNYSGIRHFCRRIKRFDYRPMIDRSTRENRAPTQRLIGWNAVGTVFCTLVTLRGNGGVAERERVRGIPRWNASCVSSKPLARGNDLVSLYTSKLSYLLLVSWPGGDPRLSWKFLDDLAFCRPENQFNEFSKIHPRDSNTSTR